MARAFRALNDFEKVAFTLHLRRQIPHLQLFTGEQKPPKQPSHGEGKEGEAFTLYSKIIKHLHSIGEEVKAKIEKQRTRVRARKTMKSSRKAQNEHSFSPSQKEERFSNKSTELSRRMSRVLNHCCGVSNNPFCLAFPRDPCK